jgi:methylase of polypeptide subunit release factors
LGWLNAACPRSAMTVRRDFFDSIDTFGPMARNVLKTMLASGHKIIGHRNTFVHVDRRADRGVFGPAIDTLYLNEMLFKYLYEDERLAQPHLDFAKFAPSTADYANLDTTATPLFGHVLEIGSGNGLLIASFVTNVAWMDRFAAIDPSLRAVACTYRATAQQRLYRKQGIGEVKGSLVLQL